MRLVRCQFVKIHAHISIHAPLAGCDKSAMTAAEGAMISIHAPLAGCDWRRDAKDPEASNFNPRTPCGMRHYPAAGSSGGVGISIHAPLAGCD